MARAYIQHQYPLVSAELVRVQRELMDLMVAAADPLAERKTRARRESLEKRRAQLLDAFGRLGLGWLMEGGMVELIPPRQETRVDAPPPAEAPSIADPLPDPDDRVS